MVLQSFCRNNEDRLPYTFSILRLGQDSTEQPGDQTLDHSLCGSPGLQTPPLFPELSKPHVSGCLVRPLPVGMVRVMAVT